MGLGRWIDGKNRFEEFEDFEKLMKSKLKTLKDLEGEDKERKYDTYQRKLKKKIWKFIKKLNKLGVEVYNDKGDLLIQEDIDFGDINFVFDEYVVKTLKEIEKEINRRLKAENE